MTNVNWERWARATGIGFVVMFIAAFIVYGNPPKVNDSAQQIASFFDGHRGRVLTGDILFGVAFILLLVFIAAIASTLRESGRGGWGAGTIAGGWGLSPPHGGPGGDGARRRAPRSRTAASRCVR